jgi:hypothetical protein
VTQLNAVGLSRVYAAILATFSAGWWGVLLLLPSSRTPFLWSGVPESVFLLFLSADLIFIVAVPALYAWKGDRKHWLIFTGAFGYAAILTFALCIRYQSGWLGAGLMGLGLAMNLFVGRSIPKP